jgi:hypothetical protein
MRHDPAFDPGWVLILVSLSFTVSDDEKICIRDNQLV